MVPVLFCSVQMWIQSCTNPVEKCYRIRTNVCTCHRYFQSCIKPGITQDGLNFKSYDVLDNSITSARKELPTNNNLFITCDSCNEGYSKSSLIETGSVYFTLSFKEGHRRFSIKHNIVEEFLSCPVSDAGRFLSSFIDLKVKLSHQRGIVNKIEHDNPNQPTTPKKKSK